VIILSRPSNRADAALAAIGAEATGPAPLLVSGDLGRQADVRRMAAEIRGVAPSLEILVHNAAVVSPKRSTTVDGHELLFAVNHLAVYLLTHELLPMVRAAGKARIVVTASQVERSGTLDFQELMSGARYDKARAYNRSKLANVLFTYELAARLRQAPITVNCLHPGVVRTGLLNPLLGEDDSGGGIRAAVGGFLRKTGLRAPINDWALTPEAGAQGTLYLATSPEVEGTTGQYFDVVRRAESSPQSRDPELRAELWRISANLVSVSPDWP
jgi:NAD(P)-dependent dehydrogenase (short-subunit alcohol dehydrogenase family)